MSDTIQISIIEDNEAVNVSVNEANNRSNVISTETVEMINVSVSGEGESIIINVSETAENINVAVSENEENVAINVTEASEVINVTVAEFLSVSTSEGGISGNDIKHYRTTFDYNYIYSGWELNLTNYIKRTDGFTDEYAQGLTDLETNWLNRENLIYI
jgi:hypothetical protein